ncbi:MAG TPA: D-2-hydroxyacid dehydrogenase [Anaerolineae bacterium]|nr:D-2-hydroxyacid dehydrogenase [Anaerolineae bacterium]
MVEPIRVLVLSQSPMPAALIERLRAVSPRLAVEPRTAQRLDEIDRALWREIEVLYTTSLMPSPELAPNLRWVQGHFAGVDFFLDHPLLRSVTLTTSSGIHAPVMAEYCLMMLLAFAHDLPRMIEYQQRSEWPQARWQLFALNELRDATLGVVGYGSIGREVARLARAFGMRVLATKRDVAQIDDAGYQLPDIGDPTGAHLDRLYPLHELHAMLRQSDYIVLALPLTPQTRKLIDAAALKQMKPKAVLINVSRGGVIDEAALIDALRAGAIGGAALDVFEQEPLPASSPLWQLPNVIVSPHVSGFTQRYDERALTLFAENLRRYVNGEPLLNLVDMRRGY